jgi:hypothetical protein
VETDSSYDVIISDEGLNLKEILPEVWEDSASYVPITPCSLTIMAKGARGTLVSTDDGQSNVVGDLRGTIDYETGLITLQGVNVGTTLLVTASYGVDYDDKIEFETPNVSISQGRGKK